MMLRELIGRVLRRTRKAQNRTLREVADAVGMSIGHLSEVERGRKEPSSELLAAICRALGLTTADLLIAVLRDLTPQRPRLARLELARLELARLEAAHLDTAHLEPARLDAARLELARLELARLGHARPEHARLELARSQTRPQTRALRRMDFDLVA